jgi:hypothetical protein
MPPRPYDLSPSLPLSLRLPLLPVAVPEICR